MTEGSGVLSWRQGPGKTLSDQVRFMQRLEQRKGVTMWMKDKGKGSGVVV